MFHISAASFARSFGEISPKSMAKNNPEVFLQGANTIELRHRDLTLFPYKTIHQFVQFLCGYRAYLVSFLDYDIAPLFAKKVVKLVNNIEEQIKRY